jgi:hypothetical protein
MIFGRWVMGGGGKRKDVQCLFDPEKPRREVTKRLLLLAKPVRREHSFRPFQSNFRPPIQT